MPSKPLIEVHGLGKSYGNKHALQDVSLSVERGTIHGLIGPNGAGKTTLSACISGELKPTTGTVIHNGKDITKVSPTARARRGIGRSFQVSHIFTELTVAQNVAVAREGATMRPLRALFSSGWASDDGTLDSVGLLGQRDELAANLAQADRKRLELAMVIATRPELVILDEPTAGMGAAEAVECAELLAKLGQEHGTTMVITEHNMAVMFHLADEITVLEQGRVVLYGDPETVRADERLKEIYFGETSTHGADNA